MTIKVIAIKKTRRLQRCLFSEGEVKALSWHDNVTAAVCDGSTVFKFIIFEERVRELEEGRFYIIKNYSMATYGTPCLLSRRNTAVYTCAPFDVPTHLEEEAKTLLAPPSTSHALKDIQLPMDQLGSVEPSVTAVHLWRYSH